MDPKEIENSEVFQLIEAINSKDRQLKHYGMIGLRSL